MNTQEMTASLVRDFLESHPPSRLIRWVMVLFLLFSGIPQKTVAAITNYTERQVRNIRDQYEHSNGDFPREGKKRGRKKKIKKRIFGRIVKYIMDHPPLHTQRRSAVSQGRIQARGVSEDDRARIGGI